MKLEQLITDAQLRLAAAGIENPAAEAEILVAELLQLSRGQLQAKVLVGDSVTGEDLELVKQGITRRENREPLQHITTKAYFRSLSLRVGPGVFIPRPETENLVQLALDEISEIENPKVIDLGTGSGAIAISIAVESDARVYALEASSKALEYAVGNASANGASVEFINGEFSQLSQLASADFDLVVSNPPYIPSGSIPIDIEVSKFDPELALYSGEDGLDAIREISIQAAMVLKPGGVLLLEHAEGQRDQILELLLADGWLDPLGLSDYNHRERYVKATR